MGLVTSQLWNFWSIWFLWSVRLPNSIPWLAMAGVHRPLNKLRCLAAFSGLTLYSATFSMRMTIFHINCASNLVRCSVQVLMTCGFRKHNDKLTNFMTVGLFTRKKFVSKQKFKFSSFCRKQEFIVFKKSQEIYLIFTEVWISCGALDSQISLPF